MFVEFIKDHPVGIKEGHVCHIGSGRGKVWIEQGYVKEITEEEFNDSKKKPTAVVTAKGETELEKQTKSLDSVDSIENLKLFLGFNEISIPIVEGDDLESLKVEALLQLEEEHKKKG